MPTTTEFTRDLRPHSTASVLVRLSDTGLAPAPYGAVPGLGLRPLTLPMLTIDSAPGLRLASCAVGVLGTDERPNQIELDDLAAELRAGVRGEDVRRAACVVHHHIEAAVTLNDRVDHRGDGVVVAHVAGVELVGQSVHRRGAHVTTGRALIGEDRADSGADAADPPVTRTTLSLRPRFISSGVGHRAIAYQASACSGTRPQARRCSMHDHHKTAEPGIVSVTVDYPKVNAIPSRG